LKRANEGASIPSQMRGYENDNQTIANRKLLNILIFYLASSPSKKLTSTMSTKFSVNL